MNPFVLWQNVSLNNLLPTAGCNGKTQCVGIGSWSDKEVLRGVVAKVQDPLPMHAFSPEYPAGYGQFFSIRDRMFRRYLNEHIAVQVQGLANYTRLKVTSFR